ncbi:MAG: hypothetical protein AAF741_15060 [Bacteroidota bacterium]
MEYKELYPGHYYRKLDFDSSELLKSLLSPKWKYVWLFDHNEGRSSWSKYNHTAFGIDLRKMNVQARNIKLEYLIETDVFFNLIPHINQTIKLIQLNNEPPAYTNLGNLSGLSRYKFFTEQLDYFIEIEIPGAADFGYAITPYKEVFEKLGSS